MIRPLHPAKSTPSGPSKKKNSNSNSPTTDICDEFFGNLLHWTNRGLGGGSDWVAHTWRCLPCVRPGAAGFAARTHRKKRDVCATRERPRSERRDLALPRCAECLGTKPECALESMVSPITLPSRIGGGSNWVGAYMAWRCLPCVRPGVAGFAAHIHRKKRDICATREAGAQPDFKGVAHP